MNKIQALWRVFKQGQCVADPSKWKNRQITSTVLAGVILAVINLVSVFGYAIPIDVDTANAIAAGIIAVVNTILTVITTDKVGFTEPSTQKTTTEEKEVTVDEKTPDNSDTPIYFK